LSDGYFGERNPEPLPIDAVRILYRPIRDHRADVFRRAVLQSVGPRPLGMQRSTPQSKRRLFRQPLCFVDRPPI